MTTPQLTRLLDLMAELRGENGCPWDKKQTMESLKSCLLEETYEVIDAIDSGDVINHREELGDLLLQVVFQSQIASEAGQFTFDDVAKDIADKLVRRHPHVFGDEQADTPEEVIVHWNAVKNKEKQATRKSVLDGIPRSMPALLRAQKVQSKVARVGFDWDDIGSVLDKVNEEVDELVDAMVEKNEAHVREELGDLLFSIVNLARFIGHDTEEVLHEAVHKFTRRFQAVEQRFADKNKEMSTCSLKELDAVWNAVKAEERSNG